jgi:PhnB protein
MQLNPYLTFDGQAREAAEMYAKSLGGTVENLMRFGDMPDSSMVPPGMEDRLAHARVVFPGGTIMLSDGMVEHRGFHGHSLQLDFDSVDEARAVYDALMEGGTAIMPFGKTFWAEAYALFLDRFGVSWMVNCHLPASDV